MDCCLLRVVLGQCDSGQWLFLVGAMTAQGVEDGIQESGVFHRSWGQDPEVKGWNPAARGGTQEESQGQDPGVRGGIQAGVKRRSQELRGGTQAGVEDGSQEYKVGQGVDHMHKQYP